MNTELKTAVERIGETSAKVLETHKTAIGELQNRIESIEAQADRPKGAGASKESAIERQHRETFVEWLRRPNDDHRKHLLSSAQAELAHERKDLLAGSGSGAFAVPEQISERIEQRVKQANPFRGLVSVMQASTGDFKSLVDLADDSAGWVAETGTRTATGTPTLIERVPTGGEGYAYPQASEWALQDTFFDAENWLVDSCGQSIGQLEHQSIVSGNGSSRPTGFLNSSPVLTADDASPLRDASTLQYIATGESPAAVSFDALVNLMTTLKSQYLQSPRVAWVMHRTTFAQVKRIESTAGDYVFSADPTQGGVGSILGFPIVLSDYMPVYAPGANAIAFGAWDRGYQLVDRVPRMSVTVDPYSNPGFVRFYCRRRIYGGVLNADAIKILQIS